MEDAPKMSYHKNKNGRLGFYPRDVKIKKIKLIK